MQQAPRYNFIAEDLEENNLKRIETKSGNRIHISDVPGKETVFLATPQHTSISMTEMSDETGNHLLFLHSNGDIVLNAPNGRVHINSKLYSKKVGAPGKAEAREPERLSEENSRQRRLQRGRRGQDHATRASTWEGHLTWLLLSASEPCFLVGP